METITPTLVSINEVSQASHIQEKDIMPLCFNIQDCSNPSAKIQIIFEVMCLSINIIFEFGAGSTILKDV